MTTVDEVRAHVNKYPADTKYLSDSESRLVGMLQFLLAENARLQAIEGAARVAADMTVIPVGERTFGKVSVRVMGIRKVLRDALAAYDATEPSAT
jgi:hypothetical protein